MDVDVVLEVDLDTPAWPPTFQAHSSVHVHVHVQAEGHVDVDVVLEVDLDTPAWPPTFQAHSSAHVRVHVEAGDQAPVDMQSRRWAWAFLRVGPSGREPRFPLSRPEIPHDSFMFLCYKTLIPDGGGP